MSHRDFAYRPITPPLYRQVSSRAAAMAKLGVDVLDLRAVPWTPPGPNVIQAARAAAEEMRRAPAQGLPELRAAIAERNSREYGASVDPDHDVLVTNGSMQGLWLVLLGLLEDEDEVLITAPGFLFERLVRLAGARPVFAPMSESDAWRLDPERLAPFLTGRTRILYVCNPDNPTGRVSTHDELAAILEFAERHDLFCIVDEVFDHQVFDGHVHVSALGVPIWKDHTIVVQSFTKSYAMPGWRVGNLIAPPGVISHLTEIQQMTMLDLPYVPQAAALEALRGPQGWVRQLSPDFQRNRDRIDSVLGSVGSVSYVLPRGGAFFFLNVRGTGLSSEALSRYLLQEHGIPVIPGYGYRSPGAHVRLAFGADPTTIDKLIERLPRALHAPHQMNDEIGAQDGTRQGGRVLA